MLVVPEQTYPLICVAVSKGTEHCQVVRFGTVNPNSTSSWFTEAGENTARLCQVLVGTHKHESQSNPLPFSPPLQKPHRHV